jgi:hypothetical protein
MPTLRALENLVDEACVPETKVRIVHRVGYPSSSLDDRHGAGRNMGRKAFLREHRPELLKGIDVRFYCGRPDLSELPEACKNAASVTNQIEKYGPAEIVDQVDPYGCLMAGDWEADAPWRQKKGKASGRPVDS